MLAYAFDQRETVRDLHAASVGQISDLAHKFEFAQQSSGCFDLIH
jgi:hypothetical protein